MKQNDFFTKSNNHRLNNRSNNRSRVVNKKDLNNRKLYGGQVRGNVQQIIEKYVSLANDAFASGDRVAAEGYYQHVEHYRRLRNKSSVMKQDIPSTDKDSKKCVEKDNVSTNENVKNTSKVDK